MGTNPKSTRSRDRTQEQLELEEILLGYLRSSRKVKLTNLEVKKDNTQKSYQVVITFDVNDDFPGNLTKAIDHSPRHGPQSGCDTSDGWRWG